MRRIPFIVLMLTVCSSIWATSVSKEQARRQAELFLEQNSMSGVLTQAPTDEGKTRSAQTGEELYYVFNVGQNQGYVIVSGDDRTESILGYATSGTFDAAAIPENMAAWLDGYADQIRYIQENDIQTSPYRAVKKAKATVKELITTKWGQDAPYNNYCPRIGIKTAPTGCSATALAQVMAFWKHPKTFNGTVPGYTTEKSRIAMPSLPATTFDWANMADDYTSGTNAAQQEAVARLLSYVATALESDFGANGTGASDTMYVKALSLFGYAGSAKLMRRVGSVSAEQWDNLIYHEISSGRPVVYNGQAKDGGHAFVLHGYKDGYYAVNWGWKGYQDNYFLLDAMTPESGGIGHHSGGYNSNQTAVIGISPTQVDTYTIAEEAILENGGMNIGTATKRNPSTTRLTGVRDSDGNIGFSYLFKYVSNLINTYTFDLGFMTIKEGETSGNVTTLTPGYKCDAYTTVTNSGVNIVGQGLANGEYRVVLACREKGGEWKVCKNPNNTIISMVVTSSLITMKVVTAKTDTDPTPSPSPGSEVSQQQLNQLTVSLNDVITRLNSFAQDLSTIGMTITDNKDAINEMALAINAALNSCEEIGKSIPQIATLQQLIAVREQIDLLDMQTKDLYEILETLSTGMTKIPANQQEVVSRHDLKGNRVDATYRGVQIIRLKNGKTFKVVRGKR
jgi:hypothetical protein